MKNIVFILLMIFTLVCSGGIIDYSFYSDDYISFKYPVGYKIVKNDNRQIYRTIKIQDTDEINTYMIQALYSDLESPENIMNAIVKGMKKEMDYEFSDIIETTFKTHECLKREFNFKAIEAIELNGDIKVVMANGGVYGIVRMWFDDDAFAAFEYIDDAFEFLIPREDKQMVFLSPDELLKKIDEAKHGDREAQSFLSYAYLTGDGIPRDEKKGFYWTKVMADAGYVGPQYQLSILYEEGVGTGKDLKKAKYWKDEAVRNGYKPDK